MSEKSTLKEKLQRRLRSLKLDRVDFVPAGANPESHITFFKQEQAPKQGASEQNPPEAEPTMDSVSRDNTQEADAMAETEAADTQTENVNEDQEQQGQGDQTPEAQEQTGQSPEEQVAALQQEVEALKTERDEAKAEVEKAKGDDKDSEVRKELEEEVERLRKAERRRTFIEKAREFDGLGQPERIATLLEEADENLSEEAQDILSKMLKAAASQEATGELFKQLADPDAEPDKTAAERLADMARERVSKSEGKLTFEQAQVEVANENPDLKREVHDEVRS